MPLKDQHMVILKHIQEGLNDTHQLAVFTRIPLERLLILLSQLEKDGFVKIDKKVDTFYQEAYWECTLTRDGKEALS